MHSRELQGVRQGTGRAARASKEHAACWHQRQREAAERESRANGASPSRSVQWEDKGAEGGGVGAVRQQCARAGRPWPLCSLPLTLLAARPVTD